MRFGWTKPAADSMDYGVPDRSAQLPSPFHKPWYTSRFKDIGAVTTYWLANYASLRAKTKLFTKAFYKTNLPPEVLDAVSANLSILKSPTVLRQYDGRLWGWEGCNDNGGSCPGTCTHVWNYAQSLPHLFPDLERGLRETELGENQDRRGHQSFRAMIPIRPMDHSFYAAADGQLGRIMKFYRDWSISGDADWLRKWYPRLKLSMDYCIRTWNPRQTGTLEEPHHNTYDIEFWGANGMTTSIYLGALEALIRMGETLGDDIQLYRQLFARGKATLETALYNGRYFIQQIKWKGLNADDPVAVSKKSFGGDYSAEALALLQKEGPKYQYGNGCLSDGIIGAWMGQVCGLGNFLDSLKVTSHLASVYRYNFKRDLSGHVNTQRGNFAIGREGGLTLCSWPDKDKLSLPFSYSDEVWTGVEYQVAAHLIMQGHVKEGLELVRTTRKRYDGTVRNPFDEYECGHYYARAMSSYALLQALTGVRYDAVDQTLYIDSRIGNFVSFLSTATGFGNVIFKDGKAKVDVVYGRIDVRKVVIGNNAIRQ